LESRQFYFQGQPLKSIPKTEGELQEEINHLRLKITELEKALSRYKNDQNQKPDNRLNSQADFSQNLIDLIPSPIFYKNIEGEYLGCNRAFAGFFGKVRSDIIGKTVYEMGPKEIADKYFEKDRELFEHPGMQVYDWKAKNSNGVIRDVVFYKATFPDNGGKVGGLIGVMVDVTERKKAELALRENEARFRAVSELISDFAYSYQIVSDDSVTLEWMTDAFTRISGFDLVDMTNEWYWDKIACSEDLALMIRHAEKLLSGHEDSMEFRIITKDGTERWIQDTALPIFDEKTGQVERVIGAAMDITDRKQTEDALRRQHEALQRKNIALREVLNQIEDDEEVIKGEIAQTVDQVLMPALKKLIHDDGTVNRSQYDVLQHGLSELLVSSSDILKIYSKLSPRETEICNLIRGGATSKEISDTLYITVGTVKKHRETIRRKLGLTRKDENLVNYLRRI
jgi:PAS domain S-box-containing protein